MATETQSLPATTGQVQLPPRQEADAQETPISSVSDAVEEEEDVVEHFETLVTDLGEDKAASLLSCLGNVLEQHFHREETEFVRIDSLKKVLEDIASGALFEERESNSDSVEEYGIVFKHACRHYGCTDQKCILCSQCQDRRCLQNFSSKYVVGDALRAFCGADIVLDVVHGKTQTSLSPEQMKRISFKIGILSSECSRDACKDRYMLNSLVIRSTPDGSTILKINDQPAQDGWVHLDPTKNKISDIKVLGSTESMLSGTKPKFCLVVVPRIPKDMNAHIGLPKFAFSEPFAVTSLRSRSVFKAHIPHVCDPLSKLKALGNASQLKLKNLRQTTQGHGIDDCPFHSVQTVGEYRDLILWAEEDAVRRSKLKKALNFTRGWDEAKEHALRSVCDDSLVRLWLPAKGQKGLLFPCTNAIPDFTPISYMISKDDMYSIVHKSLISNPHLEKEYGYDHSQLMDMVEDAKRCWFSSGHPGWSIMPVATGKFSELLSAENGITKIPVDLVLKKDTDPLKGSLDVMAHVACGTVRSSKRPRTAFETPQIQPFAGISFKSPSDDMLHDIFLGTSMDQVLNAGDPPRSPLGSLGSLILQEVGKTDSESTLHQFAARKKSIDFLKSIDFEKKKYHA
ncbi:hypothetical protein PSENEW3_00003446 [Picochlorum sp. SENEW3]|nr:hypothetical protein PSENEW3_00003446 [Picochlorum sp. SENEW3]